MLSHSNTLTCAFLLSVAQHTHTTHKPELQTGVSCLELDCRFTESPNASTCRYRHAYTCIHDEVTTEQIHFWSRSRKQTIFRQPRSPWPPLNTLSTRLHSNTQRHVPHHPFAQELLGNTSLEHVPLAAFFHVQTAYVVYIMGSLG